MNNFIIKPGDILKIRSDLRHTMNIQFGVNSGMETYRNLYMTVDDICGDRIIFKGTGWSWNRQMIGEIIKGINNEQEVEETRDYVDFKVGDYVRIRNKEELENVYGRDEKGIRTYVPFTTEMESLCGRKAIITDIYDKFVDLKIKSTKISYGDFTFTPDMIEIYKGKDEKEVEKESNKENEKIIKEMISKVDVKNFKKILASAFRVPSTKLKGIDKLLHNWAEAKKDLYKLLGNELKVSKEFEYDADANFWEEEREKIAREFPGIGYMLLEMPIKSFIDNKYIRFSSNIDRLMRDAKEGMKLTTFLSNAFNNSDFDTALSKIIDAAKVKGNIVISIDPVDFLTMSFNQSGWCSCHTISHRGESRNFGEFVRRYI